jgi:hypothetical protein
MAEDSGSPGLPWASIMGVLAFAGGILFYFAPLTSSRPKGTSGLSADGFQDQDVNARLWQDPLETVEEHVKHEKGNDFYENSTHQVSRVLARLRASKNQAQGECKILAVMIPGGPHAEQVERRLRDRVAVVEGLKVGGFIPNDEEHMGYFQIPWTREKPDEQLLTRLAAWDDTKHPNVLGNLGKSPNETSLRIPYEWFGLDYPLSNEHRHIDQKRILVLWLRSDYFVDYPLHRLAEVLCFFADPAWPANIPLTVQEVAVLGPANSGMLRKMLEESTAPNPPLPTAVCSLLQNTTIYSHLASASEATLTWALGVDAKTTSADILNHAVNGPLGREDEEKRFRFKRTTTPDDRVFKATIEELERRNVKIKNSEENPDNVALVMEWDSFYGRTTYPQFMADVDRTPEGNLGDFEKIHKQETTLQTKDPSLRETNDDLFRHIYRFSYLRGIDGKLPGPSSTAHDDGGAASGKKTGEKEDKKNSGAANIESPEGLDQSDYLRRLASAMASLNRRIMREDAFHRPMKTPKLDAIGVMGSDVFDKIEVLHALRPRLPGALFFTNSMDARLAHPAEQAATHNLIIVSSFGLTLHPYYQQDIPPFRDAYQTACFASTLLATGVMPEEVDFTKQSPRIFEVGRTGPYNISIEKGPANNAKTGAPLNVHPPRHDLIRWWTPKAQMLWYNQPRPLFAILTLIILVSFSLYIYWTFRWVERDAHEIPLGQKTSQFADIAAWMAIPVSVGVIWWAYAHDDERGEPFAFFEGISIWPTEGCRVFVGMLCIFFLLNSRARLRRNISQVDEAFFKPPPPRLKAPFYWRTSFNNVLAKLLTKAKDARGNLRNAFGGWNTEAYILQDKVRRPSAPTLWKEYLRRGTTVNRAIRIAILVLFYIGFVCCLSLLLSLPTVPARGIWARKWDVIALTWSVLLQNVLIFYVVDATLLMRAFIRLLNTDHTLWPHRTFAKSKSWRYLHRTEIATLLDIRLIAMRSKAVAPLIYYPFITLPIMILCRMPLFDNWDWPVGLIVIFSLNCLIAVICAFLLRNSAESAREKSLHRLKLALDNTPKGSRAKMLQAAITEIKDCAQGAFAPISQQPVVRALALQGGGVGLFALLQALMK